MSDFKKFAELMREGAAKRPQGFGSLFPTQYDGRLSCALGAAWEVIHNNILSNGLDMWPKWIDSLFIQQVNFPCGCRAGCVVVGSVGSAITHLNDDKRWTRERIADWVESLEEKTT